MRAFFVLLLLCSIPTLPPLVEVSAFHAGTLILGLLVGAALIVHFGGILTAAFTLSIVRHTMPPIRQLRVAIAARSMFITLHGMQVFSPFLCLLPPNPIGRFLRFRACSVSCKFLASEFRRCFPSFIISAKFGG